MRKTVLFGALAMIALAPLSSLARALPSSSVTLFSTNADTPPAAVKAAVTKLYPTAQHVKFDKEQGDYEASFTLNGKRMSVVLDAKGTVKETETTIATSALPATVREYVAKHYTGKKIQEAAEIVDANGTKTYEAEVGDNDLLFDAKGRFIK